MIQKIQNWWRGEFIPTPMTEILGETAPTEKFRKPAIRVVLERLWKLWRKRWTALIPIILSLIGIAVALFIHFDSKAKTKTTHEQNTTKRK